MKAEDTINRLHEEVVRQTTDSKKCLHAALVAAWQAGQLLLAEKQRVRQTMGAAWGQWIKEKFHGSNGTAQNYMRLAESTPDVSTFAGLSLRQVYLRLGIATEPKCRADSPRMKPLPDHIRLAGRLLVALNRCEVKLKAKPEQSVLLRQDLQALYERLRRLFEPGAAAGLPARKHSDSNRP